MYRVKTYNKGANLKVGIDSYSLDPAREYLHKKNSHTSGNKNHIAERIQACSSKRTKQHVDLQVSV